MTIAVEPRADEDRASWRRPTRLSGAIFSFKVSLLRLRRTMRDALDGPRRLAVADRPDLDEIAGESRTALWSHLPPAEGELQVGKIENLRVASRALDGLIIPDGASFSFWRHVGQPSAHRGFRAGRMLQEGCMVAAVGGGLCQLSNALYEAALQADCRIIERHPHSHVVPGSAASVGRDATVAWNYVDLRFAPHGDLRLDVQVTPADLVVRLMGGPGAAANRRSAPRHRPSLAVPAPAPRSCASCDEVDCFRHRDVAPALPARHV